MKVSKLLVSTSSAFCAFAFVASTAVAAPVKLSKTQMDEVVAGHKNNGGNKPNGVANGVHGKSPGHK